MAADNGIRPVVRALLHMNRAFHVAARSLAGDPFDRSISIFEVLEVALLFLATAGP
ncbi:hypothetical protein ACFS3C_22150 [Azotobacter vinelandii]|uniref:hypothetical protein n=1 Tax=Azotobacter TaxID=352 RepID=UPI001587A84C|nr:hypothetical protein [Azotobacter vinelandii]WKN21226.1 hypothetical protein AVAEIV_004305 [Azotobacter vinelandii]